MAATVHLVKELGGVVVSIAVLIELVQLGGREKLKDHHVLSLLSY
jgi:adenine phosphoribosyltransferase